MFGLGKKTADTRSGQQRRAAAVRDADRAGHAAVIARASRRRTAVETNPPARAWWRSS
ncbi:hypothetical protein ACFV1W_37225 [Kitasatospora sp. NPDC059648]|uniref:hypothetical protein n=1 Tax=Kitasatospora sp. NPDC059648 TaxID=3346894 RepID=UPI00367F9E5F